MAIEIKQGINKLYCTNKIIFYTKIAADKRMVSLEELLRLFQESGHLSADEMLIYDTGIKDLNIDKFKRFFEKNYEQTVEETALPLETLQENLNLFKEGHLNRTGLLLFGDHPSVSSLSFI